MPLTTTYDQWMKDTHSLIKPRSEELKKIDNFIKARNERETLKSLTVWIDTQNKKGQDWHRSVRNTKNKAVERLAKEVGYMATAATTMTAADKLADSQAKYALRKQIASASQDMFQGKTVVLSNVFLQGIRNQSSSAKTRLNDKVLACEYEADKMMLDKSMGSLSRAGNTVGAANTMNSLRKIANQLEDCIESILNGIPDGQKREIIDWIFGTGAAEFAATCAPFIGTIMSGGKTITNVIQILVSEYEFSEINQRKGDVRPGDASAALASMLRIIDSEVAAKQKSVAIHGSAFAAKASMLCAGVPGDSIAGAAECLMKMLHNLNELAKQYREMNEANKRIAAGDIDVTIFNTCPILGCYYVLVGGDFTLMNFDIANMGKQNWAQEILRLKLALEPVKKKAVELINNSSIVIEGWANVQGLHQEKMWRKITQPMKDKFGSHASKPGMAQGGFVKEDYKLPGVDSGKYSEQELMFLKMFEPA